MDLVAQTIATQKEMIDHLENYIKQWFNKAFGTFFIFLF
jgi:hypothetical protein